MAIDVSLNSGSGLTALFGAIVILAVWAAFVMGVAYLKGAGLDRDTRRQRNHIRRELSEFAGEVVVIPDSHSDRLDEYRGKIQAAAEGHAPDVQGVRGALGEALEPVASRLSPSRGEIPRLAKWLGAEALVLAIFASVMSVSVSALRDQLGAGSTVDPIFLATTAASTVGSVLGTAAAAVPGLDIVWALVLTLSLTLYPKLLANAIPLAVILAAGAAALVGLDRRTDTDLSVKLYPDRSAAAHVLPWVGLALAVTLVPAYLGAALSAPVIGGLVALTLGVGALGLASVRGLRDVVVRIDRAADDVLAESQLPAQSYAGSARQRVYAYLLLRKGLATLGVLVAPVALWYLGQSVLTGRLIALVGTIAVVPWPILLGGVVLLIIGLVRLSLEFQADFAATEAALRRALSQQRVRALVFVSVGPAIAGLLVGGLTLLIGLGVLPSLVVGSVVFALSRWGYRLWQRATHRVAQKRRGPRTPASQVIEAGTITSADGERIWVARVGTHWLAWPSLPPLVDACLKIVDERFESGDTPPSRAHSFYQQLNDFGDVDAGRSIEAEATLAKRELQAQVRPNGADITTTDEMLAEEFDEKAVQAARKRLQRQGWLSVGDRRYRWHGPNEAD